MMSYVLKILISVFPVATRDYDDTKCNESVLHARSTVGERFGNMKYELEYSSGTLLNRIVFDKTVFN